MRSKHSRGVLVIEDALLPEGREFPGFLFGAPISLDSLSQDRAYGEVVFNTSMTGYQEILTDPSYYGQLVCMTVPHVGNTGINLEDSESSRPHCGGFIVHEYCEEPSNWRSKESLDHYLCKKGIPGLYGVDTRALTRHLRALGVVRGIILQYHEREKAQEMLNRLPLFEGRDLIAEVTTQSSYLWPRTQPSSYRVIVLDFGVKRNLLNSLSNDGCEIEVVPAQASAEEILAKKPDGVFLSNGPGDPTAAPYAARTVRQLLGQVPLFGVCMGHQILALALGAKTYKLKFGHRGGNQPVLDRISQRVEISSHNHGYAVDGSSLPADVEVTHINLNDHTIEGLAARNRFAFSVQYHPESCPGPHDSRILFERFINLMKNFSMGKAFGS